MNPTSGFSAVQPVVLVGGQSQRFGRDKLVERVAGRPLVAVAIEALSAVFARGVCLVGPCSDAVRALAPQWIDDRHGGIGPMGGIFSALAHFNCDLFVLAGDLPRMHAEAVRQVAAAAEADPQAEAVLARSAKRIEPCIGVYRVAMQAPLADAIARSDYALFRLLTARRVAAVPLPPDVCANVNWPSDLPGR